MTAATTSAPPAGPGFRRRFGRFVPWLLLAPGLLWLLIFYVLPVIQMFTYSISEGSLEDGFVLTLSPAAYIEGLTRFGKQFLNSILYGGLATLLTFCIGFPVAYAIAFRGGRYKNLILFLVIAPFFTSFLIRTISWKILLGDEGPLLGPLKHTFGILPGTFTLLGTPVAQVAGLTYNFLPFMILPLYVALEKIDPRLIEAAADLYAGPLGGVPAGHVPARAAGRVRGLAADVHPGDGRLHQRRAAGQSPDADDRQRHPEPAAGPERLPGRVGPVVHPHGRDRARGGGLCPRPGHRAADRLMATTSTSTTAAAPSEEAALRRPSQPLWQKIDRYLLPAFTILAIIYLLIPIAVMIVFSFNKPDGQVQLRLERVLARRLDGPVRLAGARATR